MSNFTEISNNKIYRINVYKNVVIHRNVYYPELGWHKICAVNLIQKGTANEIYVWKSINKIKL